MGGEFDTLGFNEIIIVSAFQALSQNLNAVLFDLCNVDGFELKVWDELEHAQSLCAMLPDRLKYAFFTKPHQQTEREFARVVFGHQGLKINSTSDLDEAIGWLKGQ